MAGELKDSEAARESLVVAIDGPAGAGKSTLAARLSAALGLPHINTGLMYRAVAARALAEGTNPEDGAHLGRIASAIRFSLSQDSPPGLVLDGLPPERSLQASEVEQIVSEVARHPEVRSVMRREQRSLGRGGCVMEGRDIGTVVFPDADVKIFLSAEPGIRAGRRQRERGGDGVEAGVARRDSLDARTNPLVPAEDAHVLDTTKLTRDEMFEEALRIIHEAGGSRGRGAGG